MIGQTTVSAAQGVAKLELEFINGHEVAENANAVQKSITNGIVAIVVPFVVN
jgi:hypothetical protein